MENKSMQHTLKLIIEELGLKKPGACTTMTGVVKGVFINHPVTGWIFNVNGDIYKLVQGTITKQCTLHNVTTAALVTESEALEMLKQIQESKKNNTFVVKSTGDFWTNITK